MLDVVVSAKAYHLHCSTCKTNHYHSNTENSQPQNQTQRTYLNSILTAEFVLCSKRTAFQRRYLFEVAVELELGRSFEDIHNWYNRLYGQVDECRGEFYKKRVEDAYFLLKLLEFCECDLTVPISPTSNRINIDELCDAAVEQVFTWENEWKRHKCNIIGCAEGFVICDGNEKLSRRICAAPKDRIRLSKGMPRIVARCGNSPVFGGRNQTPSKFCKSHICEQTSDDGPPARGLYWP